MAKHPLLNEQDVIEIDGVTFTHQAQPQGNYKDRYRAFSSMQDYYFETILRHLNTGEIHRTTTVFDEYNNIINRKTETMDTELDKLDRKNVKTLINNYMMNKAHLETR